MASFSNLDLSGCLQCMIWIWLFFDLATLIRTNFKQLYSYRESSIKPSFFQAQIVNKHPLSCGSNLLNVFLGRGKYSQMR